MQHRRVVSWLSQHNFPHGLISFADGLSTDPLGHKAAYLSNLINVCIYYILDYHGVNILFCSGSLISVIYNIICRKF